MKDIETLKNKAKAGNAKAQNALGYRYEYGIGTEINYEEAFKWYKEAAEQGNAEAQNRLGYCYCEGIGTEINYKQAIIWYGKAAEQKFALAQFNLAECYKNGIGTKIDYKQAIEWYEKAAEQEDAEAQSILATWYLNGIGCNRDIDKAQHYLTCALNNGQTSVKYFLDIIENLKNGREIKEIHDISELDIEEIHDISELDIEEIEKNNYGAIQIKQTHNSDVFDQIYKIEDFIRIKQRVLKILSDIENNNRDNELEVFMQIYVKLAKLIEYDDTAIRDGCNYIERKYTCNNLIGGLLQGKCLCGGYAETLRNILACREIESRVLFSNNHVFNQVKINGNWYYVDLTWDRDKISRRRRTRMLSFIARRI